MKIALIGYGKMGKTIEKLALKNGHEIVLKVNSETSPEKIEENIQKADVAIEFSRPELACRNITMCIKANVPVVCGTTGWYNKLEEVKNLCNQSEGTLFYSANFSIGVNVFFEINSLLASLMSKQPQYDEVLIHECHHLEKLDSPSGTAIVIAQQIIEKIGSLKHWVNYKTDESINLISNVSDELPIFSSREDDITGTHIVKYFSNMDEIEIIHKALSRDGFAMGALAAAEWLPGKKGVFGMKDLLNL